MVLPPVLGKDRGDAALRVGLGTLADEAQPGGMGQDGIQRDVVAVEEGKASVRRFRPDAMGEEKFPGYRVRMAMFFECLVQGCQQNGQLRAWDQRGHAGILLRRAQARKPRLDGEAARIDARGR